jgi:hypothetical protein
VPLVCSYVLSVPCLVGTICVSRGKNGLYEHNTRCCSVVMEDIFTDIFSDFNEVE